MLMCLFCFGERDHAEIESNHSKRFNDTHGKMSNKATVLTRDKGKKSFTQMKGIICNKKKKENEDEESTKKREKKALK